MSYQCPICGDVHDDLPDIGSPAPYYWTDEAARHPESLLTEDLCIVEGRDFFVRGVITIPLHDDENDFGWGVWVSLKKENFEIYRANFDTDAIGPFFGWLSTEIGYYPESTLALKTMAHFQGKGMRPRIEVEASEHPLSRQHREGISLAEAWEIVHGYMDDAAGPSADER
jgi:hypothetical protein